MTRNVKQGKAPKPKRLSGPVEPVVITTDEAAEEERIDVFSVDGVMYTMPASFSASIALQAMECMRQEGEQAAVAWMLETALGEDGYEALLHCKSLKPSQLEAVVSIINDRVMGAMEETAKN